MQDLDKVLGNGYEAKVPDLDWASLEAKDVDNIPTENHVEVIPQLVEQWSNRPEVGTRLSTYVAAPVTKKAFDVDAEVDGVVERARKEMMMGVGGAELGKKLASMFPDGLIKAAVGRLKEAAEEQGLLGSVYVDLSCFDSCREASEKLGPNRTRLAEYVIGEPRRHVCSTHHEGYCKEMGKKVVAAVPYDDDMFARYTKHLRVAGILAADESVTDKETLRDALLRTPKKIAAPEKAADAPMDIDATVKALSEYLDKGASTSERNASDMKFAGARPILAFAQDEMLKGRMGAELIEAIGAKFPEREISANREELERVASLQGLLGNVYVDVAYYSTSAEAVDAIKTASTRPSYLVNSRPQGQYDTRIEKVAHATGCVPLPMDGVISAKAATGYLNDLKFAGKVAPSDADAYTMRIVAGDNPLGVLREAFLASASYRPEKRMGGVSGSYHVPKAHTYEDRSELRTAALKALESGLPTDSVQSKIAAFISAGEAASIVHSLLYKMPEVNASCLTRCVVDAYPIMKGAMLKKASKCEGCVNNIGSGCMKQGAKFAGEVDLDKAFFDMSKLATDEKKDDKKKDDKKDKDGDKKTSYDPKSEIEPHMRNVIQDENPDVQREDMKQPYDVSDEFGSGGNKTLDALRQSDAGVPQGAKNDGKKRTKKDGK